MLCIKNKQTTPIGPCFCMRTSIRNRKIGGSVTLVMGELAYFVDFFALVLYNLTSTVKNNTITKPISIITLYLVNPHCTIHCKCDSSTFLITRS